MSNTQKICVVVPTNRPKMMEEFVAKWEGLFSKHDITLVTVWDDIHPEISIVSGDGTKEGFVSERIRAFDLVGHANSDLFCRKTDAVRNYGFVYAAQQKFEYILTLDDDVHPPAGSDPIQEHLDVLNRKVPISWMNAAVDFYAFSYADRSADRSITLPQTKGGTTYLRGFPYGIRDEAPVMVSHGVWVNVPDFDGKTQLELTSNGTRPQDLPYSLPYFRGPVPKGCLMPICGMNLMVRREALPYLYFAPMGPDSGFMDLNRFSDIWMGIFLKRACDTHNWAIYTGASTVSHSRASDPHKNAEQEKLGMEWNEKVWDLAPNGIHSPSEDSDMVHYWKDYSIKRGRFYKLIIRGES